MVCTAIHLYNNYTVSGHVNNSLRKACFQIIYIGCTVKAYFGLAVGCTGKTCFRLAVNEGLLQISCRLHSD